MRNIFRSQINTSHILLTIWTVKDYSWLGILDISFRAYRARAYFVEKLIEDGSRLMDCIHKLVGACSFISAIPSEPPPSVADVAKTHDCDTRGSLEKNPHWPLNTGTPCEAGIPLQHQSRQGDSAKRYFSLH